jgi:O-antigen ligase
VCQLLWGNVISNTTTAWGRMTGFTQHVNDLGGVCALAALPALAIALEKQLSTAARVLASVVMALGLAGLVLSGSVAGMAAASVSLVVWLVMSRPDKRQLLGLVSLGLVLTAAVYLQQEWVGLSPLARIVQVTGSATEETATAWSRIRVYEESWTVIRASPLVGVGLDSGSSTELVGDFVHNMFLAVWLQAGFFGLLGLCTMEFAIVSAGVRAAMNRTLPANRLSIALLGSQAGAIVLSMASPILQQRYAWVPAALILATRDVHRRLGDSLGPSPNSATNVSLHRSSPPRR